MKQQEELGMNLKVDPVKIQKAIMFAFVLSGIFGIGNLILMWNLMNMFGRGSSILGVIVSFLFALLFYQSIRSIPKTRIINQSELSNVLSQLNLEEVKKRK